MQERVAQKLIEDGSCTIKGNKMMIKQVKLDFPENIINPELQERQILTSNHAGDSEPAGPEPEGRHGGRQG